MVPLLSNILCNIGAEKMHRVTHDRRYIVNDAEKNKNWTGGKDGTVVIQTFLYCYSSLSPEIENHHS